MLFNSFEFLIFFCLVYVTYWLLNNHVKRQNILLLLSSYFFYGWWDWRFLSLIIFSSFLDFAVGIKISESTTHKKKKNWLFISLFANLGFLCSFKYFGFFCNSFVDFVSIFGWEANDLTLNIILPVGISFYTFQTLSYSIDVYKEKIKPSRDIIAFFTFVSFFPQLVAGPIERASHLLPQIEKKRVFKKESFNEGIIQILIGLFRKIVIADSIGAYVDIIYGDIEIYNSSTIALATFLYAFQIYFDFSGYSDIAIGTAKTFGLKFYQNFNLPYFSKSLTEFWRKWHISLSFWLRDYLYIPLGGNRNGIKLTYRNLMLTMLIGGFWHGANWTFIIWGGIHGLVLSLEKYAKSLNILKNPIKKMGFLRYLITFSVILISWIFFRSTTLNDAFIALKKIFIFDLSMPFIGNSNLIVNIFIVLLIGVSFDIYLYKSKIALEELGRNFSISQIAIYSSIIIVLINLFYSTSNNFIYFQF
jgi:alginate O-acetyltransferase complex protein AlgI